MKLLFFLCFNWFLFYFMATSQASELALTIDGFQNDRGSALIALVNSRKTFEDRNDELPSYKSARVNIVNGKAQYLFRSVPQGEYAIKIFHDQNDNQHLDKGFLGIPTEDYGFSNNVSGTFGPPDYDEAMFIINIEKQAIHIQIQ